MVVGMVLATAAAGSAWAGTVGVKVKSSGGPIAGASVSVAGASGMTDSDGVAVFENVASGSHTVTVLVTCRSRSGQTTAVRHKTAVVAVTEAT